MNIRFSRESQLILVCAYVVLALGIFSVNYYHQVLSNHYLVNDDDLAQIFYFYNVGHKSFSEVTPIARYYLDLLPLGYKYFYKTVCSLGIDPIYFSKLLTAFLFLTTLFIAFALGYKLANFSGGLFLFTMVFICEGFFERMAGGLPRAFGYPTAFLFCYGIFAQNIWGIVLALVGSVLFYPPLTPFMILYTSFIFFFPHRLNFLPLTKWPLSKRFFYLTFLGIVCLLIILPPLLKSRYWGPMLSTKEMQQMPEMQAGGRYDPPDRTPSPSFFQAMDIARYKVFRIFNRPQQGEEIILTDRYGSLFLLLCLLPYFICSPPSLTSLTALWLVLTGLYEISAWFYPHLYIPNRFTLYFMPIFILEGIVFSLKEGAKKLNINNSLASLVSLGLISIIGLTYAPRGTRGFVYDFKPIAPLYQTIQKLPEDAVIVGWPDPVLDAVPLFGHRPILAGYETYQLFHRHYLNMMRQRMKVTLKLLFTNNKSEFEKITHTYGIKYILFPRYIYQACGQLQIFTPFTQMAQRLCTQAHNPIVFSLPVAWQGKGYRLVRVK
ncbi:MAG: hypothetical protein LWW94_01490 [Candidatus Desulfofervidaceae bacterium]|nr:hypothetical protein [Candidatus Desulfofervidaceae bacterium]